LLTKFEQPTFSSNFLTFEIKPTPGGGLNKGTNAEVRFKDRAMFEFVSLLEKARERAIYMARQLRDEEEGLRKSLWLGSFLSLTLPVDG
jgi:WW domain-binding protein 2